MDAYVLVIEGGESIIGLHNCRPRSAKLKQLSTGSLAEIRLRRGFPRRYFATKFNMRSTTKITLTICLPVRC